MKTQALDVSAIGAFGLASTSGASSYFGWFNFINSNAPGIGVLLSLVFGVIGVVFMFKSARKERQTDYNKKEIDKIKLMINKANKDKQCKIT